MISIFCLLTAHHKLEKMFICIFVYYLEKSLTRKVRRRTHPLIKTQKNFILKKKKSANEQKYISHCAVKKKETILFPEKSLLK